MNGYVSPNFIVVPLALPPVTYDPANPSPINFVFNANPNPSTVAGEQQAGIVNAYYQGMKLYRFFKDRQPDSTLLDGVALPFGMNFDPGYWGIANNGGLTPYHLVYSSSGEDICSERIINLSQDTMLAVAYGLFIQTRRGLGIIPNEGTIEGGYGLALAALAFNKDIIGDGWRSPGTWVSNFHFATPPFAPRFLASASCIPPNDFCEDGLDCAEAFGRVWWDINLELGDYYDNIPPPPCPVPGTANGECGLEVARKTFTEWTTKMRGVLGMTPLETLQANDDAFGDGDLWNGAPDYHQICLAFSLHNDPNSPTGFNRCPFDDCGPPDSEHDAVTVANCQPNQNACQDANKNNVPAYCDEAIGRVRYVDGSKLVGGDGSSWANAFNSLTFALGTQPKEIWVKQGNYYPVAPCTPPNCDRTKSFVLRPNQRVYGGFKGDETRLIDRNPTANPTILSGDLARDDLTCPAPPCVGENAFHVVTASPAGVESIVMTTLLDGFTITAGNADGTSFGDDRGGGLYLASGAPTIRNCIISGNRASFGAGAYENPQVPPAPYTGQSARWTDCTFLGNVAATDGGGLYLDGASPVVERCRFEFNTALGDGGGALVTGVQADPLFKNVRFHNNRADGLVGLNSGQGGGVYVVNGAAQFHGALWSDNFSHFFGSALYNGSANITIFDATITKNQTQYFNQSYFGAIYNGSGNMKVRNSIIWDNCLPSQLNCVENEVWFFPVRPDIAHSILRGTGYDPSNISDNPRFVNPDAGDYSLACGSPAIDRGDNTDLPKLFVSDLSGLPRRANDLCVSDNNGVGSVPIVDLGAFERQPLGINCNGGADDCAEIAANSGLDCNNNCMLDECDMSLGISLDSNFNSVPDECEGAPLPAPPPHNRRKNRYISFRPNSGLGSVAYRVEKISSPPGTCWVAAPDAMGNSQCVTTPVFRSWTESVVHVGDCEIIPVANYEVRSSTDGISVSPKFMVDTILVPSINGKLWADTVGSFNGVEWTPPNQIGNVNDVLAILARISGAAGRPHFTVANLGAVSANISCVDAFVNASDVLAAVQAVAGASYGPPSSAKILDPCDCPTICPCGGAGQPACQPNCEQGFAGGGGEEGFAGGESFGPEGLTSTPTFGLTSAPYQINADATATVNVFLDAAQMIAAYEVSLDVTPGTTGSLTREAITINTDQSDYIFYGQGVFQATNALTNVAGAAEGNGVGVLAGDDEYLATFTLRASPDAYGVFEVRVSDTRSFLLDASGNQTAHDATAVAYVRVGCECTSAIHCDDGNQCTSDVCTNGECVNANLSSGTACNDGLFCTLTDTCNGSGVCAGSATTPCVKPNPVCCEETDSCHPTGYSCELE